jgi:hypothetical protein
MCVSDERCHRHDGARVGEGAGSLAALDPNGIVCFSGPLLHTLLAAPTSIRMARLEAKQLLLNRHLLFNMQQQEAGNKATLTSPMESKPSSWLSSSSMVRWISRSPPLVASYRFVPIASISSAAHICRTFRILDSSWAGAAVSHSVTPPSACAWQRQWLLCILQAPPAAGCSVRHPAGHPLCLHTSESPDHLLFRTHAGHTVALAYNPNSYSKPHAPMKTMDGDSSSATRNSSRTSLGPSPRYFCMSSEPTTRRNDALVWFATALASSVLPVPGSPYRMTPCGGMPCFRLGKSAPYDLAMQSSDASHSAQHSASWCWLSP